MRIGIIQGGKIIEERIVRRRETVTVGSSEKNHFILTAQEFPVSRFEMFETRGGPYILNFDEKMSGRVSLEGEVVELAEMRASGKARKKGKVYQLPLSDKSRGKVVIGETTILFQFVAPPPIRPRPQLPAAVRGGVFRSMDWFITTLWVVSFLLHGGIIFWWETTDWPKRDQWDKFMELQELIASDTDATFEKKKKSEVEEGEGDEEELEDEGEVEDESQKKARASKQAAADTGPKKSAEEIARERAEKRAQLAEKLAEKGINKILGTLGGEGADGAIADVLKGGDVGADQDDLLEQVGGVGVATSEKGGSLKGPAGGKGSGEAENVDQVKVKGGDKTVKTEGPGQERKVKGRVRKKQPMSSGGTGMLKQSDVAKVINRRIGAIKGCYERALKRDPSLQGKVTVQFTISGSGRVTNARATSCEVGAAVCSCITSSFKRFRFPPPEGGSVTFQMPFLFTPSG
ncbi:MAG: AgmX/PglI C-terminal domain-containing protein [Polyangia bacterium]